MLILRRVRLINWHFFGDAVVELGETTLLAGENGSGKSTIIDAIQYALVSDIRKIQFNAAAAHTKVGRNLDSYARCKIGAKDLDFYRKDSITHVVLEFQNVDITFLAGIMIAAGNEDLKETLWILEEGLLEDLKFYDGEVMVRPKLFKTQLKNLDANICSTKREYNTRLTHLLRVHRRNADFNPYLEALVRSVSFTPITSINSFVCDYILEERQVDISAMKENLLNYKEAEKEALAIEKKIDHLEKIKTGQQAVEAINRQILMQEYLQKRLYLQITGIEKARTVNKREQLEKEIIILTERKFYIEERIKESEELLLELRFSLKENDVNHLLAQLSGKKQTLEANIIKVEEDLTRFNTLKKQCESLLNRDLSENLDEEIETIDREKSENTLVLRDLELQHRDMQSELSELRGEERDLEKGILRYPESSLSLKKALADKGIDAVVFADCLEVMDRRWQNAVEGWLNTQRFNILVSERDFQKALEIYDRLPKKIAGVGLPNLMRMHDSEISPGSLAEIVDAASPQARRYGAYLMGKVIMTSIEHLKEYSKSITKECMRYSGHTASRIREEIYSRWYIGKAARERRLKQLKARILDLEKEAGDLVKKIKYCREMVGVLRNVHNTLYELRGLLAAFEKRERYETELKEVNEELEALDTSEIEELRKRIDNSVSQLKELRDEQESIVTRKATLQTTVENYQLDEIRLNGDLTKYDEELEFFINAHMEFLRDFESYYKSRVKANSSLEVLNRISANYDSAMKGFSTKLDSGMAELRNLKHDYNLRYHIHLTEAGDDSAQFISTLKKYKDTDLPGYREKIERARREAELQFREHFVSRLNEYLSDARENFSELNHTLKNLHFGQDQYRFTVEDHPDSKKKKRLRVIREAAKVRDYDGTIFEQLNSEEERRSIEEVFESILRNELNSEEVREICDYRKYFRYDIKIKHTQTPDRRTGKPLESSLTNVLREKSGGETQTPYYVALAASFYKFYKDEKDAIRLILFDEAFNKMDDDRIGKTIDFLKKLNLQVVTAVPTQKMKTIVPYMDKTNLIIRKDYNAFIRDYSVLKEKTGEPV